jgi:dTDP-4-amino-4,6-dideoxygalactose transaminase
LKSCKQVISPIKADYSTHVYHQYTIQVKEDKRDFIQVALKEHGIPSMIYYPLPIHYQDAYKEIVRISGSLEEAVRLSRVVLSLPIHTEMPIEQQQFIMNTLMKVIS